MSAVERRYTFVPVELRTKDDRPRIGGYAIVFNRYSQNLGGFVERAASSVVNKSKGDGWPDVMARYNHDDNQLLGTTAAGTLQLRTDETGLDYEVDPPRARADVVELVERGDIRKSSFAFRVLNPETDQEWDVNDEGFPRRTLLSVQLVDVAPVNAPAYLDSTAALRSLAVKMEAEFEDVRSLARAGELRKFFVRTDGPVPVKPKPREKGAVVLARVRAMQASWNEDGI